MRRQRNNIATSDPAIRRIASRLIYDGRLYADIRTELAAAGCAAKIHNSALIAWQKSAEYLRYRAAREKTDNAEIRAIAQAQNDGQGPRDELDVAVGEVIREYARHMRSGEVTDLDDLGAVSKALAPLLRAQIAADAESAHRREAALAAEIAKLKADLSDLSDRSDRALAAKDAEIARLKAGGRAADPSVVADQMDAVLGVRK